MSSVLVARFDGRSGVAPVVRAALDVEIVYVALPAVPAAGRHILQLYVGDELVAALGAELVGSGRDGEYPLRMRLLDPAHGPELEALAEAAHNRLGSLRAARKSFRREDAQVSSPPPSFTSDLEEKTLTSATNPLIVEDRTLASRPDPSHMAVSVARSEALRAHVVGDVEPVFVAEAEVVATTVFDPESMLRATSLHTGSEDQTLQLQAGGAGARRSDFFTDDESQTLPGQSSRKPGAFGVSWNVRIAPTTKDPLCGRTIDGGKYVLDSVIGSGAIGIVFKASHRDLGRTVAVKVLNPRYRDDPDILQIFRTEARAASQLEHPNVARVYDYGQEPDGLVYIVMEYLSGYTLGSVLGARRKLGAARAVEVMVQVCAALSAAHDRGIVHRDVKPDNIVLVPAQDDEGQPVEIVKVCDFGIAALGTMKTEEGVVLGTPEYMAPEQTMGSAVTPAADVYACGVVLYEMLAGVVPFTADQAYRILMKHRGEAPRPPTSHSPSMPLELEALVLRCLEKAPERRFATARELRVELKKIAPRSGPRSGASHER